MKNSGYFREQIDKGQVWADESKEVLEATDIRNTHSPQASPQPPCGPHWSLMRQSAGRVGEERMQSLEVQVWRTGAAVTVRRDSLSRVS